MSGTLGPRQPYETGSTCTLTRKSGPADSKLSFNVVRDRLWTDHVKNRIFAKAMGLIDPPVRAHMIKVANTCKQKKVT